MKFGVVVVGQIVKDFNYLKGKKSTPKISPGGTGFYSTYSYYNLGLKTTLSASSILILIYFIHPSILIDIVSMISF